MSQKDLDRHTLTFEQVSTAKKANSLSRYYSLFYSLNMTYEDEMDDELVKTQKRLHELKSSISKQSRANFLLEKDVRFLDSRIALLIENRKSLDDHSNGTMSARQSNEQDNELHFTEEQLQSYGNLFFLLQTECHHIASLCCLVRPSQIDSLLQTVMFTLYGNQLDRREEHLLLILFQNILAKQFEASSDTSLLRANTPVSRMLTAYTRRSLGQSYLKQVLSKGISKLVEDDDLILQINPLKVYDELITKLEQKGCSTHGYSKSVTYEVAASHPEVQAIIKPRLDLLMQIASEFLMTIISSIDQVPYGIRWICKQIRSLTKRKHPNTSESTLCSLVASFFFLRFINSAIVTPQAHMLTEKMPSKNCRVTLTLIAKLLQNLANKPLYVKEFFMTPTSSFVVNNKQRMNQFLNDLCDVSDFYDCLELDEYMALSKNNMSIQVTPNELFNLHDLLSQHINILAPDPQDRLRILVDTLGMQAPQQVPRKYNTPITLPLVSRWATDLLSKQGNLLLTLPALDMNRHDILYMETKLMLVQIIRSFPQTVRHLDTLDLISIANTAARAQNVQWVHKGIRAQFLLKDLLEVSPDATLLVQEIKQELIHLGDLKQSMLSEIASLEKILKALQDHNRYLTGQLQSYKAYLQNARMQNYLSSPSKMDILCIKNRRKSEDGNKRRMRTTFLLKRRMQPVEVPLKYTYRELVKDGVIMSSEIPKCFRDRLFLLLCSPTTGVYVLSFHHKEREKPIVEIELRLDDLLEMVSIYYVFFFLY
ncbi:hypothetical protein RMATCC62417_07945 [Rhizopus microsporus]|nr:hypothetical protein RMATCC62417_07945 [Rhizopus microsporus]